MSKKSIGQIRNTPAIVTMVTLTPEKGRAVDVVTFADGHVMVIAGDGVELWPSERALLESDPAGDFPEMIGFIEYEAGLPSISFRRGFRSTSTRFGRAMRSGLRGALIQSFDEGVIYLHDGCRMHLQPGRITMWSEGEERMMGEMTWEVEGQ